MLGSVHDAEDGVQETLARAWRYYDDFEGRASLRTWLYKIATNTCLRALEYRGLRPLPSGLGAPGTDPDGPAAAGPGEVPWLEPIPDTAVQASPADPASIVASRAGLRLALIAALQYLPRQRAVLILRDVMQWRAAEFAELLGTTPTAVNGLLLRARSRIEQAGLVQDEIREPAEPGERSLLDRYATAFENASAPPFPSCCERTQSSRCRRCSPGSPAGAGSGSSLTPGSSASRGTSSWSRPRPTASPVSPATCAVTTDATMRTSVQVSAVRRRHRPYRHVHAARVVPAVRPSCRGRR